MEWQPIETAPKDGTRILGYGVMAGDGDIKSIATVAWCRVYSVWNCDPNESYEYDPAACALTHWMPLPEPPPITPTLHIHNPPSDPENWS